MMRSFFQSDSFHRRVLFIALLKGLFLTLIVVHLFLFLYHSYTLFVLKGEQRVLLESIASQKNERLLIESDIQRFERGDVDFMDEQRRRYLGFTKNGELIVKYPLKP